MATQAEVARAIGITLTRFRQLLGEGEFPPAPKGEWDIEVYRKLNEGRKTRLASHGNAQLARDRARLARSQAEAQEAKNREMYGRLIDVDEMCRKVADRYAIIRERLMSIPGKLAGQMNAVQAALIEKEIIEALNELSTPAKLVAG